MLLKYYRKLYRTFNQPIYLVRNKTHIMVKKQVIGITKSGGRKHVLDKFYTKPDIAKYCLSFLQLEKYSTIIEPSAGSGAFSNLIPNVTAYDLHPEQETIIKQNWLTVNFTRDTRNPILVVGNPPFGEQNKLAVDFINHSATFAHTIAFILPLSFMKESVQKSLDPYLHLQNWVILPKKSFILNGKEYHVPCVFQIWEHKDCLRTTPATPTPVGFSFIPYSKNPDFYLQRIGGKAGTVGLQWEHRSLQSNYFVKVHEGYEVEEIMEDFRKLTFPYKNYGVGPRSISKKEVLLELKTIGSKFVD